MRVRSTITIPREKREALLEDLQQASGYTAATQDWEILSGAEHPRARRAGRAARAGGDAVVAL